MLLLCALDVAEGIRHNVGRPVPFISVKPAEFNPADVDMAKDEDKESKDFDKLFSKSFKRDL